MTGSTIKSKQDDMFTLLCVAFLFVLALVPSKTKSLTEEEELERQRAMKRDIELGLLAIEPPPGEDPPLFFNQEKLIQAEEDRDHLYHPRHEVPQQFQKPIPKMEAREILNEPEEDRDHLYHQ